ncbi:MAG: TolC family protein [candidate division Zixibacteria bacterium]|nr:TolC family protein [candidate division Zixibacteria bacterium]
MSQEHAYGVKASRFDSLGAVYDYRTATALRFPLFSLNASSFYASKLPSAQLGLKKTELGSHNNYQSDFRLSLPLYAGGKITNQIRIQRENISTKSLGVEVEKLNNAYLLRKAYLNLLLSRSLLGVAETSLSRINIISQDVQSLYRNGLADSVDLLEAELIYQKGLRSLAQNQTVKNISHYSLAQLVGLSPLDTIIPIENIPIPGPPDSTGGNIDPAAFGRPELKVLDSRIRTATTLIGLNKSDYFPTLIGYVGYSNGKPNRDQFNKTWDDYYKIGLSLNWEFNLGGKVKSNSLSARQSLFSAQMTKSKLAESLALQATVALENLKYAYQVFTISGNQLDIANHQFRLAKERQKVGHLSVNRLLELEADLTATEQTHQTSIINYFISETDYLYTIGSPKIFGGL